MSSHVKEMRGESCFTDREKADKDICIKCNWICLIGNEYIRISSVRHRVLYGTCIYKRNGVVVHWYFPMWNDVSLFKSRND